MASKRTYKRDKIGRFSYVSGGKGKSNSRKKGTKTVARHAGLAAQEAKTGSASIAMKAAGNASQKSTGSKSTARSASSKGNSLKTKSYRKG